MSQRRLLQNSARERTLKRCVSSAFLSISKYSGEATLACPMRDAISNMFWGRRLILLMSHFDTQFVSAAEHIKIQYPDSKPNVEMLNSAVRHLRTEFQHTGPSTADGK